MGLTTISDAGLSKEIIFQLDSLQKASKLKMRLYVMVADDETSKKYFYEHGKYKTDRLNVCSIKYYADGALGSRGACLKQPYADEANNYGMMLKGRTYFQEEAKKCFEHGFQMNTPLHWRFR